MAGTVIWITAALLALSPGMARADAPQAADLIGYGRIRMTATPGAVVFDCESPE